ncbi:terminase small subunit [Pseudomonas moraviensis]|uniref:Terminase n=1 Tax=Pseudomonas moraviensis R28-S TaxID=1395516 RepID=V8R798_9PSED|nr:terminase small subunit [Pseudomonas moraviensis]ETF07996.1 terminase [Pseudomonas moraviensis R28-S]
MALTPKKRAFVDALRGGASNKDAAIAAGYSASSASAAGSRLAKDPHVLAELAKGRINKNVKAKSPTKQTRAVEPDVVDTDDGPTFDLARALTFTDPKAFLIAAMNDPEAEAKLRVDAAKALMPFMHQRKGETGKKEDKQTAAEEAASGKYGTSKPPLRSVK